MSRSGGNRERPWWITAAAVGGLLLSILIAGLAGILSNLNIQSATDEALRYDVELEDHGDDLRVAILDLRHYHRNLLFYETTPQRIDEYEQAYDDLQQEIDELEELGIRDPETPQPDQIRSMASDYYETFRPAIGVSQQQPDAFEEASDDGLRHINEMDAAAEEIDKLGERLTAGELEEVDQASANATTALAVIIAALLLAGTALAYLAVRVAGALRRLYASEQESSRKLAEASRARTEFLADVSHELRTPLTVLKGNAEMGLAFDREWPHRRFLEEIVAESDRMTRMVEDLLFLARSDSSAVPLEKSVVSVQRLLEDISGRAEVLARERGAILESDTSGSGEANVDQKRIEQAALILVDNAAKYGPPGGRIRLSSYTQADRLILCVSDEGPGIPEQELHRIFERFYRLDKARSRKDSAGGAGLGLPIARTIAESHGGKIEAKSSLGNGTQMTLHLPVLCTKESPKTPLEPQRAGH
ncbi:MAG: ATP-binding protein [Rubrobacter sp.]|nr:ATP-binding protein [Rubrobacter sp.]